MKLSMRVANSGIVGSFATMVICFIGNKANFIPDKMVGGILLGCCIVLVASVILGMRQVVTGK